MAIVPIFRLWRLLSESLPQRDFFPRMGSSEQCMLKSQMDPQNRWWCDFKSIQVAWIYSDLSSKGSQDSLQDPLQKPCTTGSKPEMVREQLSSVLIDVKMLQVNKLMPFIFHTTLIQRVNLSWFPATTLIEDFNLNLEIRH